MPNRINELVSIKISVDAHHLLRYCPTLGINMQDFASDAIEAEFKRRYPELYEHVVNFEIELAGSDSNPS